MSKAAVGAIWLAAIALVVLAGISAYSTFTEDDPEVAEAKTWVEYAACLEAQTRLIQASPQGMDIRVATALAAPKCEDLLPSD